MASVISNLIKNTANDPDEVRRANLLNIMLIGIAGICILVIALILVTQVDVDTDIVLFGSIILGAVGVTFLINQNVSGNVASLLFLVALTIVIALSDAPVQVINGRSLFLFTIPILLSSVLLRPYFAFIATFFVGVIINVLAFQNGFGFQFLTPLSLFGVGMVAWIASKSLDDALKELRLINSELDERVEERTMALKASNLKLQDEIEERIKAERELILLRDRAVSASQFKSELLARVSHELRTPLGAILGYLEMLRAKIYGSLEQEQEETINTIIDLNQDLTRLVTELLDQARLDSGQIKMQNDPFSPTQLAESIFNRLSILAENKEIRFEKHFDPDLPDQLCGDVLHLQQIFINLVGNAIKFTDKGFVKLNIFNVDKKYWGIKVSDSGIGIPEEDIQNIFEVFQQVGSTYTRSHGGFGLGLSIVKQLVSLMEGTIGVESQIGKGSEFIVYLPKNIEEL